MFPTKLDFERGTAYYRESDCFTNAPMHLVHAYFHPNYNIKMHTHQFYEINIIVAGEGRHYVGDVSLPAGAGDVFVLPPEISHGYFTNGALDVCHILLRADFMARYREEMAALPGFSLLFDIEPLLRRASGRSCNLHLSAEELRVITTAAQAIIEAEASEEFTYQNVLTLAFIGRMGALLLQSVRGKSLSSQEGDLLRVMAFIRENIDQKLTLEMLAAKANMSKATLNRHFRETLSISPIQYVTKCRLDRARELLARGGISKSEIAQLCGFFDVSHMNKYL